MTGGRRYFQNVKVRLIYGKIRIIAYMLTYEDLEIIFLGIAVLTPSLRRIFFHELDPIPLRIPNINIGRVGEVILRVIHGIVSTSSFFVAIILGAIVGSYLLIVPLPVNKPSPLLIAARSIAAIATAYSVCEIVESLLGGASLRIQNAINNMGKPGEFYNPNRPFNFWTNIVIAIIASSMLAVYVTEEVRLGVHSMQSVAFSIVYMTFGTIFMLLTMERDWYQSELSDFKGKE
ncbi:MULTISPECIES: hypothetical protein [Halorussus]|uniref:hypothetical protein n=1 Tax=Halorussus TaxID=1070314 RepID=UPI0020A1632F|nr:hypothetical protein [Halorussus vallis]USZ74758.1 hypothetical protein NGM07_15110 [Halorussus vallis]